MRKIVLLLLIPFLLCACKKNKDTTDACQVDEYINIYLPQYIALQTPLNYIYYGAGCRGLIVYRRSSSDFTVLERTCTFDPSKQSAQVEVLNDNITCIDSTCGSRFNITDGSLLNGPATQGLLQYRSDFDGTTLHIYN
jgi:nitrite reductase/ring-hydroxylating ferredoxin subunit